MTKPCFLNDELFRALRSGDTETVGHLMNDGDSSIDLSGADLRGTDLRQIDTSRFILRNAYLKDADLRGLDLRGTDLRGCSLHNAKIGGAYFPENLTAAEICLSVQYGSRLRAGI